MATVSVRNVWKEYGPTVVLENLRLEVADHEFVTIVGASGCGKTTFLKLLLGVEQPTRGQILIDGKPIRAEPGPDRGIVFQRYSLFPHLTAIENLVLGLELRRSWLLGRLFGAARRAALAKAGALLEAVGLGPARDRYPAPLSGGMQQRRMTIFMISHDLQESFALGTRLLTFDKLRHDPQSPDAYGAGVTYDIRLQRRGAAAPLAA